MNRSGRRVAVAVLGMLAVASAALWIAPAVLVHTSLRDRPLVGAFAGIDGTIESGAASWGWFDGIEYRDVVLRDRAGRAAVMVPRLAIDRGLVRLALDPASLGAVRLADMEAIVEVRGDGSSLEDILAPWLATVGRPVAMDLEIVGATIELVDTVRRDAWRLSEVIGAGTLLPDGSLAGWTAAGRLRHSDGPRGEPPSGPPPATPASTGARLDRSTLPAAAAAVLVREGGWSVSSPAAAADGSRTVTIATHRLPLGGSSVIATRFGLANLVDGIADLRIDVTDDAAGRHVSGDATLEQFAVCAASDLTERFAVERVTMPFDVSLRGDGVAVRRFAASSPAFQAEASGMLRLPGDDLRDWVEHLAGDDFSASVDVDLAAAARALPGGLAVRPDVRVTGGSLRLAAAARPDGGERVIEVRATVRDLAAVQAAVAEAPAGGDAPAVAERQLAWPEPFAAWLRGRRSAGRDSRLVVEEARIVSQAIEVSASGTPAAFGVQWTADVGGLVDGLAGVLDLGPATGRGRSRGRIDVTADPVAGGQTATVAASLTDIDLVLPGRPTWRDTDLAIEAEAMGAFTTGAAAVEQARVLVAAGDDRLEASLAGGAVVDVAAVVGLAAAAVPAVRPAANATSVVVECSLRGELASWHPRLAVVWPALAAAGLELSGRITASTSVAPQGDGWQWQRAGAEVEKFVARWQGREIAEPRVVVTSAGRIDAASGRVDLSAAEILSTSLSLRTGGGSWLPPRPSDGGVIDRLRGRMQWQADVGRVERWFVPGDVATRWPVTGRGWGTVEIVDTQAGLNVLVEATGSQLALAAGGSPPRSLWAEPRLVGVVEVTRPRAAGGGLVDRIVVDRLAVESSTLAVAARGRVDDWATRRMLELDGTVTYDWQQVMRLMTPWVGDRVRLAGAVGRPFALRGPLGVDARPGVAASPAASSPQATLPLPDDWLAATRGTDPQPQVTATVVRASGSVVDDRLRSFAIDTSAAWTTAEIEGLPVAAGEVAVRLLEGQLALGPLDLSVSGGRIRGAPWLRLVPAPGELIIPPGRVVERVPLAGGLGSRFANCLSPVLGHSTTISGAVTADLAGARLPLGDAFGGELAGQVLFEGVEVAPAPAVQPLANLIVKLQSVVDPRFAFGDKAVLMRVRPEPVRVRLAGRRLAHEGLVMDTGQLVVTSQGSVGEDGSLDMRLEVSLRGDLVGRTPVLGQLFRTPLVVPLKGTVQKPQFDAAALDAILGRIVENTAEAVIKDGIGRGLEAVFGQPPPAAPDPAAPASTPLALPPQR
ncbi:MAG: hypothetical protein ACKOC8_04320 [Pirellulales bacterium]